MSKPKRRATQQLNRRLLIGVIVILGLILATRVTNRPLDRYVILPLANYPPGSVSLYVPNQRGYSPFFVVHPSEGEVYAIVARDPLNGCRVAWNPDAERFVEACDGHQYDLRGESIAEGVQRRLARYHVEPLADDGLLIDQDTLELPEIAPD